MRSWDRLYLNDGSRGTQTTIESGKTSPISLESKGQGKSSSLYWFHSKGLRETRQKIAERTLKRMRGKICRLLNAIKNAIFN